jgi:hypothetical protein
MVRYGQSGPTRRAFASSSCRQTDDAAPRNLGWAISGCPACGTEESKFVISLAAEESTIRSTRGNTVGTDSNGMMKRRRTVTCSTCVTMISNRKKLRNAFSTITISPLTTDVSTTCILSMEKLIGAENCGSFSKIKEMDWLVFLRVGN